MRKGVGKSHNTEYIFLQDAELFVFRSVVVFKLDISFVFFQLIDVWLVLPKQWQCKIWLDVFQEYILIRECILQ